MNRVLAPRQITVLRLAAEGLTNSQIAERLGIGPESVKTHLHVAYQKLEARNRAHAVTLARGLGYFV
jgi:DNA-binding CsgD family transcriptional regulator